MQPRLYAASAVGQHVVADAGFTGVCIVGVRPGVFGLFEHKAPIVIGRGAVVIGQADIVGLALAGAKRGDALAVDAGAVGAVGLPIGGKEIGRSGVEQIGHHGVFEIGQATQFVRLRHIRFDDAGDGVDVRQLLGRNQFFAAVAAQ